MILPNQLTVTRIILTPIFFVLFLIDNPVTRQISVVIYIIAALTDWYDGWLARKFNYITDWGKFLDPLADKILTSAAFIAFTIEGTLSLWMVIIIVGRDILITLLRSYAEYHDKQFTTSKIAKWKTFFQMIFIYYLLIIFVANTIPGIKENYKNLLSLLTNQYLIYYTMLTITIFTFITGVSYLYKNRLLIKRLFKFETKFN